MTDLLDGKRFIEELDAFAQLGSPERPRVRIFLAYIAYQFIIFFLLPLVFLRFLWMSRHEQNYRKNILHRFGLGPVHADGVVWIFAASLGEVRAVSPVVRQFTQRGGHSVCLTTNTAAGFQEAQRLFQGQDVHVTVHYAPIDFFPFVLCFLKRQNPKVGLIVESELWPGYLLLSNLTRRAILKVNGNLLERSVSRDLQRLGGLRLEFMRLYHGILTKTETYSDRYIRAGVDAKRVFCVGELKFDQWREPEYIHAANELRQKWSPNNPVLMIASSVQEEEEQLLSFVDALVSHPAKPRIIWAPRSPAQFDAVSKMLRKYPGSGRRSELLGKGLAGVLPDELEILVGDSLGEMNFYYQMSDVVFVGATLAPRGGHNIVEPLVLKKPVLTGSSVFGITYPALDAEAAGALYIAENIDDLIAKALELVENPLTLESCRVNAETFSAAHLGASERTYRLVSMLFPDAAPRGSENN